MSQTNTSDHVLPNNPFFTQLLRHAHRPSRLALRDLNLNNGEERTYAQLLSDALNLRSTIRNQLNPDIRRHLSLKASGDKTPDEEVETCIGILAPGGVEYVTAFLAVQSLGATAVPMSTAVPVNEAAYFVRTSRQIALLTSESHQSLCDEIAKYINRERSSSTDSSQRLPHLISIPILPSITKQKYIAPTTITIPSQRYLPENAPGTIIFTSGTTGPPKGAVLRRAYLHDASRDVIDLFSLTPSDTLLHVLPVHHVTGLAINILPFLLAGATIEFKSGNFSAEWTWKRLRQGGITIFSGVPTILMRMMRYHQQEITQVPITEQRRYEESVRNLRLMLCGTSALPEPVQNFWTGIRGKNAIVTRYGSTEAGAVLRTPPGEAGKEVPDGSVGTVAPGVDLKLVPMPEDSSMPPTASSSSTSLPEQGTEEEEEGEIHVKTPYLFSHYLHSPINTTQSFTQDGYFRTGDIARRKGKYFFITGRASQDIIKSGGYKISALDIEREILGLDYINEVVCVGVEDKEWGQRVGVVVTLREGRKGGNESVLTLERLRNDLREKLAGYKIPTLLRVVGGELPKTASGKVVKKALGREMFPVDYEDLGEVQVWKGRGGKARL